jgi:hypothetical protein
MAKPTTSVSEALQSEADAGSQAAARRRSFVASDVHVAAKDEAFDMGKCLACFGAKWNQLGVNRPCQNAAIWLPHGGANAIPRP